ncbi:ATP-binding protein [Dongia sp.]|uniref:sensor histidine kinase n=1 Tax=Dongia sp. TaxID=1977262 RepID=UPI0037524CAF
MAGKFEEIAGLPVDARPASAGSASARPDERRLPKLGDLRHGIGLRLLVFVLLFSSAVTLVLTAVQLYLDYRFDVGAIEQRLAEVERGYLNSLAEGLWQLDQKQLELQLKGIATLPEVSYAAVIESGNGGSPLMVATGAEGAGAVLRREIPIVYDDSGGRKEIGRFVVEASLAGVYQRLIESALVILVSQGAKTFLVSAFIVFVFYRLVGRHLFQIAHAVAGYNPWHPATPLTLNRGRRKQADELDRVVSAFNDLSASLQRSYGELKQANADLQRDVAARIAAEAALRDSEERFHDYAVAASDWFWETGPDHRITYLSPSVGLHGFDAGNFLGHLRWEMAVDREAEAEKWREHAALLERHAPFRGLTYRVRRPDGSLVYAETSGQPVFDDAGAFKGYRGVARDVTAFVDAEHALREARDQAEQASRAKSLFLANMSHELRTPLNAIIGLSEMIDGQVLGADHPKYREYAADISTSGKHLLRIINEVLDIAKIEAGKFVLEESETDLGALVEEVSRILALEAEKAELTLTTRVPPDLPRVRVDAGAIRRILFNLLSNALKFTPPQGAVLLSIARNEAGIEIVVSDTGIGIAKDDLPKLMQPFTQVEGAYQRRYRGTGLGLAIVRALVELHGGTMALESNPGRGTRVRVMLPASRILQPRD